MLKRIFAWFDYNFSNDTYSTGSYITQKCHSSTITDVPKLGSAAACAGVANRDFSMGVLSGVRV